MPNITDEIPVVEQEGQILLDEFALRMTDVVRKFRVYWGAQNKLDPAQFPLSMRTVEWFDAFIEIFEAEDLLPVPNVVVVLEPKNEDKENT